MTQHSSPFSLFIKKTYLFLFLFYFGYFIILFSLKKREIKNIANL